MTDYSKLNDRIVRQAWEFSNLTLSEELKTKLLQDKIRRAADMIQAREQGPAYFKVKD
jgi:23S rRNA pseudoU1915 N3-methylase RlmH